MKARYRGTVTVFLCVARSYTRPAAPPEAAPIAAPLPPPASAPIPAPAPALPAIIAADFFLDLRRTTTTRRGRLRRLRRLTVVATLYTSPCTLIPGALDPGSRIRTA